MSEEIVRMHGEDGKPIKTLLKPCAISSLMPECALLFDGRDRPPPDLMNGLPVVKLADFKRKFRHICSGALDGLEPADWNNMVIAGGAVLHALSPSMAADALPNGDLDVFLYGLTDEQARAKIERLFTLMSATPGCEARGRKVLAMRTPNTLTFVLPAPMRHLQIVLRLHSSANEVISCFDVDCCGVMWDGRHVWCTLRAARALRTRCNVAVQERRSWTYESRCAPHLRTPHPLPAPTTSVQPAGLSST
jgi:hypothetical protein